MVNVIFINTNTISSKTPFSTVSLVVDSIILDDTTGLALPPCYDHLDYKKLALWFNLSYPYVAL